MTLEFIESVDFGWRGWGVKRTTTLAAEFCMK